MIRLKSVEMHNFGIYKGTIKLDFDDKSIVGILAEYHNDKTRSNRSGKTLILEGIRYNLTGLCRAKKEVSMIHEGEEVMWTRNVYVDDEHKTEYVVKRGRDHKNNGLLELDWIEKTRESQEAIDELFGISREDFDLTSFFKQADINGFMDLSPTEKTSHLMKWLDNEHWKIKEEKVKDDIKHFKTTLKDNETAIKTLEGSVEISEEIDVELDELRKDNKKLECERAGSEAEKNKLDKEMNKALVESETYTEKTNDLAIRIKRCNSAIEKIKELEAESDALGEKYDVLDAKTPDEEPVDTKKLNSSLSDLKSTIRQNKNNFVSMTDNEEGICPYLNETCDRIKPDQNTIKKLKSTILKDQNKVNEMLEELNLAEHKKDQLDKLIMWSEKIENLETRIVDLKPKDDITVLLDQLKDLKKPSDMGFTHLEDAISDEKTFISDCTRKIRNNDQKIGALENRKSNAKKSLEQIEELSIKNEKIQVRLSDLSYLAMMFGKNGIPADEIENSFHEIQDDINYVLKDLDCGLTVSFSPDKELSKKESICHCGFKYPKNYRAHNCDDCGSPRMKQRKDEISLKILENGVEKDFGMDSGGGKTIISYAVRTALTMLKRRQNKTKLNILFLDEVDSALDGHLASAIIDSVTKTLTKKLGYDQILLVSHKDEIKNAVPCILKVTRYDDYSTAKFE